MNAKNPMDTGNSLDTGSLTIQNGAEDHSSERKTDERIVAFICTHNACRSQIAQAIAEHYQASDPRYAGFRFVSAGTDIADSINPDAVRVLRDSRGIDMVARGQSPKTIGQIPAPDVAISMGCGVRCPFIGRPFDADWELDDPTGGTDEDFLRCIERIDSLVQHIPELYGRPSAQ